jgi:hypothetical protein
VDTPRTPIPKETLLRTHKLLAITVGVTFLLSLSACATEQASGTPNAASSAASTDSPTTEPAPSAQVEKLPLLDGVTAAIPEGWQPGSCGALNFASPVGWAPGYPLEDSVSFTNEAEPSLEVDDADGTRQRSQTIAFWCNPEKSDWDGDWEEIDGKDSYRLDIPGSEYSAVTIGLEQDTQVSADIPVIPGDFLKATIHMVTPEKDYFYVDLFLPQKDSSQGLIRQVAGSVSIG